MIILNLLNDKHCHHVFRSRLQLKTLVWSFVTVYAECNKKSATCKSCGDQIILVPTSLKVGRDASHGSHRVVAPMVTMLMLTYAAVMSKIQNCYDVLNLQCTMFFRFDSYVMCVIESSTSHVILVTCGRLKHMHLNQSLYT